MSYYKSSQQKKRAKELAELMHESNKKYWKLLKELEVVQKMWQKTDTCKRFIQLTKQREEVNKQIQFAWNEFVKKRDAYYDYVFPKKVN